MSLEFSFELTLSFNKAAVFWIAETGLADVEPLTKKEAKISFKTEQKKLTWNPFVNVNWTIFEQDPTLFPKNTELKSWD